MNEQFIQKTKQDLTEKIVHMLDLIPKVTSNRSFESHVGLKPTSRKYQLFR